MDMGRLSEFVTQHFPELRDRDKVLHDIMTTGSYTLIDEFKVETDIKGGRHKLIIPCLSIRDARVLSTVLDENPDLLRSGMWGVATLRYVPDDDEGIAEAGATQPGGGKRDDDTSPVIMTKFTPFEVVNVRLPEFTAKRTNPMYTPLTRRWCYSAGWCHWSNPTATYWRSDRRQRARPISTGTSHTRRGSSRAGG